MKDNGMILSDEEVNLLDTLCITPFCYYKKVDGEPTCSECLHGFRNIGKSEARAVKLRVEKAHAKKQKVKHGNKILSDNPIYDNGYQTGYYSCKFPESSPYPKRSSEDKLWWEGWKAGDKQGHKDS